MQEIFSEYGRILSVKFSSDSTRMIDSNAPKGESMAYVEMNTAEEAQKAMDYMDGGLIDNVKVEVSTSTQGRSDGRYSRNSRFGGRSGGRSGGRRRYRNNGDRRSRAMGDVHRPDSGRRSPSRQGRGGRYARSPSPFRGRRMSRDRRSPVRSRSPYGRRYGGGGGGGGSRYQARSPSPRNGGYRGGRYARSRSFSRSRR
ncbi:hypothetical protein IWW38_004342 [Coemansia aciculifera]|uniref:Uncharacterized protein n=1 Tax=Coemansia aciculifera TaxID=417176 RepID=A0ACC1LXV7_9FUNG|nr:hypothetical protein IWW38_004342 [Coemansia aciculifera]